MQSSFHATGAHYINGDTTAFMQFIAGDLFKDFPTLKFIIPHGGGAVPYHWGRYRGLAQDMKRPPLAEHLLKNVFFDTCVYHQPGIELLAKVIPVDNILFASEMVGAVQGIDPETGPLLRRHQALHRPARGAERREPQEDLRRQCAQGLWAARRRAQPARPELRVTGLATCANFHLPLKRGGRPPKAGGWGSFAPHPDPPPFRGREQQRHRVHNGVPHG